MNSSELTQARDINPCRQLEESKMIVFYREVGHKHFHQTYSKSETARRVVYSNTFYILGDREVAKFMQPLQLLARYPVQDWSYFLGQRFCVLFLKFAFPPLPSGVQISKRNMHRTFDPVNTSTPVVLAPRWLFLVNQYDNLNIKSIGKINTLSI